MHPPRVEGRDFPSRDFPGNLGNFDKYPNFPGFNIRDAGKSREFPGIFEFLDFPFPGITKSPGNVQLYSYTFVRQNGTINHPPGTTECDILMSHGIHPLTQNNEEMNSITLML